MPRRLSISQDALLDGVYHEGKQRVVAAYKKARLSRKERAECKRVFTEMHTARAVRIAINLPLRQRIHKISMAESLLSGGRILNLFEIMTATGDLQSFEIRQRLLTELVLYGGRQNVVTTLAHLSDDEHPNYGILDYTGNPRQTRGTHYGAYRLVLKEEFLERATFTPFDSYMAQPEDVFCWEHLEGVLATRPSQIDGYRWYEYIRDKRVSGTKYSPPHYIEAQIFGPLYAEDVERLFFPFADTLDPWFMGVLEAIATKFSLELKPY